MATGHFSPSRSPAWALEPVGFARPCPPWNVRSQGGSHPACHVQAALTCEVSPLLPLAQAPIPIFHPPGGEGGGPVRVSHPSQRVQGSGLSRPCPPCVRWPRVPSDSLRCPAGPPTPRVLGKLSRATCVCVCGVCVPVACDSFACAHSHPSNPLIRGSLPGGVLPSPCALMRTPCIYLYIYM